MTKEEKKIRVVEMLKDKPVPFYKISKETGIIPAQLKRIVENKSKTGEVYINVLYNYLSPFFKYGDFSKVKEDKIERIVELDKDIIVRIKERDRLLKEVLE